MLGALLKQVVDELEGVPGKQREPIRAEEGNW